MGKKPEFRESKDFLKHGWCLIGKNTINENSIVIDVGAHRGWFTEDILLRFNCNVISIEPTPNFVIDLKKIKERYPEKMEIIKKAAWKESNKNVILYDFNGLPNSLIKRTFCKKRKVNEVNVKTITLNDVLKDIDNVEYLKINVEGSEIEILQGVSDETIKKCNQICVQYHNWLSKKMSKPITMEEVNKSIEKIEKLGFEKIIYDKKHPNVYFRKIS